MFQILFLILSLFNAPQFAELVLLEYIIFWEGTEFIANFTGIFDGKVKGVEIPAERALDIDTELDFEIAELLMNKVLKSNKNEANA